MSDDPIPPPKTPADDPDRRVLAMAFGLVSQLGFTIAVPVVVLGFSGAYLDKYFHTSPFIMLAGFVAAFCISALAVWRLVKRLEADVAGKVKAAQAKPKDAA